MKDDRNRINIMTSCDDNLTNYIFIQIRTMVMHLINKDIHFYLFYNRIPEEKLAKLEKYCDCFSNITFHKIFVKEIEPYKILAKNGTDNTTNIMENHNWPYEAYFSLECHRYLPIEVDRILYIDAGDVLFTGEIDEFYFDDFERKSLIVSPTYFKEDGTYMTSKDVNEENYLKIMQKGVFISGTYMIDVDKFRKDDISIEKLVGISNSIEPIKGDMRYFTDQGFLSIVFINKMKYFKFPEIADVNYQPYGFVLSFFRKKNLSLWYEPKIVHYMGGGPKPWDLLGLLVQENIVSAGEIRNIRELLEIATNSLHRVMSIKDFKTEEVSMIEPEMIPFYEYWFMVDDIVKKDFLKIQV